MALIPLHLGVDGITINVLEGVSLDIDNGVSYLLKDQIPDFVVSDHTKFLEFLEAYYEWMETEGNPKYESNKLLSYRDIDDTIDEYIDFFSKEFIVNFPKEFADKNTDKTTLIKNIKDFYKSKGTEKSYKLLFRLLYGEEPELKYSNRNILKLSSARWIEPTVLKTTRTFSPEKIPAMTGVKINQINPTNGNLEAYGFVDSAVAYERDGYEVLELELSGIFGSFSPEQYITATLNDGTVIFEYVYPVLDSIGVSSGASGSKYSIGDTVNISGSSLGVGALGTISSVGISGEINAIEVIDSGINYRSVESLTATISSNGGTGSGATLGVTGGGSIVKKSGFWEGDSGLLSSSMKSQDNSYYQSFSYVLKSSRDLSDYADIIKKIVHPAGFKLFGSALLKETMAKGATLTETLKKYEVPLNGHYTPYRFITARNLRANGIGGSGGTDLYPDGYGWSAGSTGFIVGETAGVAHAPNGGSGPLGGTTHINESVGSGASSNQMTVAAHGTVTISDASKLAVSPAHSVTILTTDGTAITASAHASTTTTTNTNTPTFELDTSSGLSTAANLATCLNGNAKVTAKTGGNGTVVGITQAAVGSTGETGITLTDPGDDGMTKVDFSVHYEQSAGPGGTLNGPRGAQFNVVGGIWGASAMSSGETGGGYWEIYPHPNSRSISSIPNTLGYTADVILIDPPPSGTTFYVDEFVVQQNPYSQLSVGKILSYVIDPFQHRIEVQKLGGEFLPFDINIIGGSAGMLVGQSGGATANINSVDYRSATGDTQNEFTYISIRDFLFGIER